MDVPETIRRYHHGIESDEHHRYRSWEHCYAFFRRTPPASLMNQRETAALQLGFYLASWGMYRGSSFLLQRAYTVHLDVVDCLAQPKFAPLWVSEFGSTPTDMQLVPLVLDVVEAVRQAYSAFGQATDTLITKVILGTLGCLPACDRYFISGFKHAGFRYSYLNASFVKRALQFCLDHLEPLRQEQRRIARATGAHYPLMKLIDMYFWQIGYDDAVAVAGGAAVESVP